MIFLGTVFIYISSIFFFKVKIFKILDDLILSWTKKAFFSWHIEKINKRIEFLSSINSEKISIKIDIWEKEKQNFLLA